MEFGIVTWHRSPVVNMSCTAGDWAR